MNNKKQTKELIIKKSREIFLENDILNTVMNDIALKVDLSVRTIYRYFESKDDLVYEVTIQLLKEWNTYQKCIYSKLDGSGIERLESFLDSLIDYMSEREDVMRYLSEFDFYFKDESTSPSKKNSQRFNEIILESEDFLDKIIQLGIKDGSMIKDLNKELMVATISNVLWGFGQRIAIRGDIIEKETGFKGKTLINNQVKIYIEYIKEV